jgi:hypothetical protein
MPYVSSHFFGAGSLALRSFFDRLPQCFAAGFDLHLPFSEKINPSERKKVSNFPKNIPVFVKFSKMSPGKRHFHPSCKQKNSTGSPPMLFACRLFE